MATVRIPIDVRGLEFASSAFPGVRAVQGTNFPVSGLGYDGTSTERSYVKVPLVKYGSGNITGTIEWYADTATTGGVVWETALAAITPNSSTQDVETKGFAAANTAADTHLGATGRRLHSVDVTISNLDSVAEGDAVWLRISRLPANASDTMIGDAILVGVILAYSDT